MHTNLRTIVRAASGSLLAATLACSSEPSSTDTTILTEPTSTELAAPDPSVETLPPILRLDVEADHTISFYEPAPGNLFLVESMARQQKSVLSEIDQTDAIEVFLHVRPGQEVPAQLLLAYERGQANQGTEDPNSLPPVAETVGSPGPDSIDLPGTATGEDGLGVARQASSSSSASHFITDHGGCNWAPIFSRCNVNWFHGFHSGFVTAPSAFAVVDHYTGNGITVQLTAGATSVPFAQAVGTVQTYSWGLQAGNINRFVEILNATNDGFHIGVRWQ